MESHSCLSVPTLSWVNALVTYGNSIVKLRSARHDVKCYFVKRSRQVDPVWYLIALFIYINALGHTLSAALRVTQVPTDMNYTKATESFENV